MRKKIIRILWGTYLALIIAALLGFFAVKQGWIGYMPNWEDLQSPISKFASQVVSADGKVLGTWSQNENRISVDYDSISPYMFDALVATEDARFYDHSGIDGRAVGRAIVKRGLLGQANAGGGSTITQQLAKQLYSSTAKSTLERLIQKPVEWVIAVELERNFTKEEILTLYLNYFDFLHNAVGIKTAANVYFGKQPKDLSLIESATLVGMCKNPSYFNPVRDPERCRERRNVVLQQMVKAGKLSESECAALSEEPLTLKFHRIDHKDGQAAYMREYLRRIMMAGKPDPSTYKEWQKQQYYQDSLAWEHDPLYGWCKKNFKKDGTNYNIYTDGLKIYTTLDSRMQRYAEEAVYGHVAKYLQTQFYKEKAGSSTFPFSNKLTAKEVKQILNRSIRQSDRYRSLKSNGSSEEEIRKSFNTPTRMSVFTYDGEKDTTMTPTDSILYYKSFLRSGMISMDPVTGAVKAYVGGLNYTHFQYDMAMMGRRQVGSTIKPFVYAMAMEDGRTPCDIIVNVQRTYYTGGRAWTPRNGSRARYGQGVTLKWGLAQSNNWVTAELMHQVDPTGHRFINLLREFGITNRDIFPTLAQSLGSAEISVAELASAYTAFVNRGIRVAPLLVSRIEDGDGNVLAEFRPRVNEVISEEGAFRMLEMLQAVVNQGTAGRLHYKYGLEGDIAGKTGTTNRNSDGWFVGMVPRLVTACWVGGEERDIHFNSTSMGQGASSALPIWAYYMKKVYRDRILGYKSDEKFMYPLDYSSCGSPKKKNTQAEDEAESSENATDLFE